MIQQESYDTPIYPIRTVARLLGVSVHTLRMYERKGLILTYRAESGHRLYSQKDIERLQYIRDTIGVWKVSIEGIKHVLALIPCWAIMDCPQSDREMCPAYTGDLVPCWSVREKGPFCKNSCCRKCLVYTDFGEISKIKDKMKDLLSKHQQPSISEA